MRLLHEPARLSLGVTFALAMGCAQTPAMPPMPDAAPVDVSLEREDASGCADFTGAYVLELTCSAGALEPVRMCVSQDGCEVSATLAWYGEYRGRARGSLVTLTERMVEGGDRYPRIALTRLPDGNTSHLITDPGTLRELICSGIATPQPTPGVTGLCCRPGEPDACGPSAQCTPHRLGDAVVVNACAPVGSARLGEVCAREPSLVSDCAAGLYCTYLDSESVATRRCRPMCFRSTDCGPGEDCALINPESVPAFGVCRAPCDPWLEGSCPPGTTCRPAQRAGAGALFSDSVPTCLFDGPAGEGEPCQDPSGITPECAAGLVCLWSDLPGPSTLTCRPMCRLDGSDCAPTEQCERQVLFDFDTGVGTCEPL